MTNHVEHTIDPFEQANMVYIRALEDQEIETIIPPNVLAELDADEQLFAVHNAQGDRIAIVEGREAAFAAARAHSLEPTSLH